MIRPRFILLAALLAAIPPSHGLAAENWNLCRIPSFEFIETDGDGTEETEIEAQTISADDSERIRFSGDVTVSRAQQKISADEIVVEKSSQRMRASGNVVFEDPNYRLASPAIEVDNQNDRARFTHPEFELRGRHARGHADEIEKLDQFRSRYSNLEYTSCDPDDRDWHLRAKELEIDDQSGRGTAKSTTLYFKRVPFLYLPYFQFPIDDRRMSGILTPRFGYSEERGASLALPVYWNMALNYDATITPTWYNERGLQLNTENRYLFPKQQGQVDLSYLDDDELDDSRWFRQWQHRVDFAYDIESDLLLAKVSDKEFFNDFDKVAPEYNDTRHLERHLRLARIGDRWHSELLWQNYQTIDPATSITSRPYNRLPRLTFDGEPELTIADAGIGFHGEWVNFDRDDSITGERSHLVATLGRESVNSWYFFKPELQLAFTDYRLDNNPAGNSINRGLPTLGIDTGLIFERLAGPRKEWLQTLEPRLYFLYTPYEDQDDIPDFDTSLLSKTYANLFQNNRFTGADRIGDASQVTVGLASKIFDNDSGDELLLARAGQIFYFRDRRVSLDGSRDDASRSDLITEIDIWPNQRLKVASRLVYDPESHALKDRDFSINYGNAGAAANLGYYFTEDDLEQALLSWVYPLNERWTLVAKVHRSLLFDKPVENLLGLNYESCCWGLKILAGQTGDEIDDFADTDNSIFFEITLKGLSQVGQDIDAKLRTAIPGYSPTF